MKQAEIQKKLTQIADVIAHILDPDHGQDDLAVDVIKTSEHVATLLVKLGDKTGVLKVFKDGEIGADAFARERKALEMLIEAQVPRLRFVAEAEMVLMTDLIKGRPLLETLSKASIGQTAEHMGQWFGCLANKAPSEQYTGDWASYLDQYKNGFEVKILAQHRLLLARSRIKRLFLAHNNNALKTFILGGDKRLYGVDFECSQMKPEGWDLITAARALFGQVPDALPEVSAALLRGYQLAAADCALADNFDEVISTIALANAGHAA